MITSTTWVNLCSTPKEKVNFTNIKVNQGFDLDKLNVENLTDEQQMRGRDVSRRGEPKSLNFFLGQMSAHVADIHLMFEPKGTYFIRNEGSNNNPKYILRFDPSTFLQLYIFV